VNFGTVCRQTVFARTKRDSARGGWWVCSGGVRGQSAPVAGENVITLPVEFEAQGFVADAELTIEPLEDGVGIALVLDASARDQALRQRILAEEREVFERLERYDRGESG